MTTSIKSVMFVGASFGVGLSTLKHTLAAGHRCIALCRDPSKLTKIFPLEKTPKLKVIKGNAHDLTTVSESLVAEEGKLVDEIVSTIGSGFNSKLGMDQPDICGKGMQTILEALAQLRSNGVTGNPHIMVCGTTGMSNFGRDVPLPMVPVYHFLLKGPIKDKKVMESLLVESGESFTILHCTHLTDGASDKTIRVGIEDYKKGREVEAIGYTISREDAGKWAADNLVLQPKPEYRNKIVTVTY